MYDRARFCLRGVALAAVLACAACGASSSPTTPSAPALTTDTFSASIAQQASVTHTFKVAATGEVTITLTSVAPLTTMSVGIGMMTSDGNNCISTMSQNDNARANSTAALQGTAVAGNYCIRVYDSGNVPESTSVTYTVTVVHP